jgi:penicillin amidase
VSIRRFRSTAAMSLLLFGQHAAASGPTQLTMPVAGLRQPAEILVDRWGVPHIYAANHDDAFLAQGFNAARDRLFQIDLWRRRGLGRLAEVLGPAYVERDKAVRLFLYRGDMDQEWAAYGPDAQAIATAFVAGINAYIDWLAAHPDQMPPEFKLLGYSPSKWEARDVVRIRSHGLTRNLTSEVARANTVCKTDSKNGPKYDQIRYGLQPPWETKVPEGLDACLPPDVLRVFTLATEEVHVNAANRTAALSPVPGPGERSREDAEGSNNWVIAPSRSATGRPILANDPHRAYSTPSLRYIAHINAPGMSIIGAGEPALPGISIGHNGTIAFGLTIFDVDQEDLYVYDLNPKNAREYRYQGSWEPMRVVRESIDVKGAAPVQVELIFTRHGPVIYDDAAKHRAYAVRTCWLEPGMSPYFGSVSYMRAANFAEFQRAMLHWGAPTENQIYADVKGNIGWVPGGLAPIRPNWDGLMPVPGDGRYEWAGFLPGDKLPSSYNPAKGYVTTSNQMNLPADYPYKERKLSFEWTNGSRHARIDEVLKGLPTSSLEDSMNLQNDVTSIPARRLVALLAPLHADDPKATAALDLLRGWDARELPESAQAALMEVWISRHLERAFLDAVLPPNAAHAISSPDMGVMLDMLEKPGAVGNRDALLLRSIAAAYEEMEKLEGADPKAWQWGKLHHSLPEHPLMQAVDGEMLHRLQPGPFPTPGGPYTPNASSYRASDFQLTGGPSFRMVLDVGNWDNSRAVNYPGQSGNPDDDHYRDLTGMWLTGKYFPLLYTRDAIEKETVTRILLQPPAVAWTAEQDHQNMLDQLGIKALRPGPSGKEDAPNHANYDESKANPFPKLPDALTLKNGKQVTSAEMWWKERRPEIIEDFEREVLGRVPNNVPKVTWSIASTERATVGSHAVIRKQLVGHVENSSYPLIDVDIQMTVVTPAEATSRVPVMMMFTYGRGESPSAEQIIADGWGYASIVPVSIQADNGAGLTRGIIGLTNKGQPRKPDDWGALRAWAWGASRGLDYLETDQTVDAKRVGIEGVSRYGKAALVTMAFDTRFALVLVGSSGEGGAKLHRRNWGEAVENLTGTGEYHWMAGNFLKYGAAEATFGSRNAGDLPVDAHELIALCAPRPTFISYGVPEKGDAKWLDQQGSYMAAVAAGPVFRLLGAKDLGVAEDYHTAKMPAVNVGLLDGELAWRQHDGVHTDGPNWKYFLAWADRLAAQSASAAR